MDSTEAVKERLHDALPGVRSGLLHKLDGLSEYDMRRPMTSSGTNLLGIVKHLGSEEYGYLGETFGRPAPEPMRWHDDGSVWQDGDMWARADESSDYILNFYRQACAHSDQTIERSGLEAPGSVPWWEEGMRATTLGTIMIYMLSETERHTGQADIVRELIDGTVEASSIDLGGEEWRRTYRAQVQAAADAHADGRSTNTGHCDR